MKTAKSTWSLAAGLLAACLAGCGAKPEDLVVAEVGPEKITAAELKDFAARLPKGLKQGSTPLEIQQNLLESLIDMKLLLMEAQATGLEADPRFKAQLALQTENRLLDLYQRREITDKIAVSPEEIEAHYHQTHRDRALRFSGVMLKTREEALQAIAQLKAGADIRKLAVERSVHRESGERGGDSGGYRLRDELSPVIAEHICHLQVGEISDPVPMTYQQQTHYSVFQILDEMPASLQASESKIRDELLGQKRAARLEALLDSLNQAYAPQLHWERLPPLDPAAEDGIDLPASAGELVLCRYRGGQITLADLLQISQEIHFPSRELADSAAVAGVLRRILLPARLFASEARALGLDRDPPLLAELERKRQELLLETLRQREVDQGVQATEEEARAFYEAHPEKFTSPETIVATEILVASDSLAQRLKRALQERGDAARLARQYTLREGAAPRDGQIRLNLFNQLFFQGIYEVARHLEIGEVGGPVRVREGYSVFKVVDKVKEKIPYDAQSQRRARAYVKVDKARRGYVAYVRGLREKYPVRVFDEALQKMDRLAAAPAD